MGAYSAVIAGLYSIDGFFDAETCSRILESMDRGIPEAAEVLHEGHEGMEVDRQARAATSFDIDSSTLAMVEERLERHRSALDAFFSASLGVREGSSFLRYKRGGFYRPHRDRANVSSWPGASRRRIAVVVFLSSSREVDPSGAFSGGALRLFSDDTDERPLDILPRAGTLVAFPATTLHEVAMVESGTRDTIVDWFY